MLSIQDEVVSFRPEEDRRRFPKKNECETVPVFRPAVEEELVGVYAILDRAANPWEDMEDNRRSVRIGKTKLSGHILHNGEEDDQSKSHWNDNKKRQLSEGILNVQHRADRRLM